MVVLPRLVKPDGAVSESSPPDPLAVVFATAGSKGQIRVWCTDRPHPLHTLEPLAGSCDREGEEEEEGAASSYTGLHYSESLGRIIGVTYDQNIIFIDSQRFERKKQVSGRDLSEW